MGRTGFTAGDETAYLELLELLGLPALDAEGIFTHFAVSELGGDPFNTEQYGRFLNTVAALESESGHGFALKHCSNSGAVLNFRGFDLNMVRPGLALYGLYPGEKPEGPEPELRPAMELKTRVAAVTRRKAGDTISYGRTYAAQKDMTVAVLPIGYADGLNRLLSGKMDVLIRGKRAPQLGRICMDMCMADITDIPAAGGRYRHCDRSELPAEEMAEKARNHKL
jgi:alanine racemase